MEPASYLIIAAIISALGAITAGGFNALSQNSTNKANQRLNSLNNTANRMLAERQNEMNLNLWNQTNAYNDPLQQMQRFRAAGLNRSLALTGAQSLAAPTPDLVSSLAPSQMMAKVAPDFSQLSDASGSFSELLQRQNMQDAQTELMQAQTDNIRKKTPLEVGQLQSAIDLNKATIKQVDQIIAYYQSVGKNLDSQTELNALQLKYNTEAFQPMLETLKNNQKISFAQAQYALEKEQQALKNMQAMYDEAIARRDLTKAQRTFLQTQEGQLGIWGNDLYKSTIALNRAMAGVHDANSSYISAKEGNMTYENILGGIGAFNQTLHTAIDAYGAIMTRGGTVAASKVGEGLGKGASKSLSSSFSNPGAGISPNYNFDFQ